MYNSISAVIPVYNSAQSIPELCSEVSKTLSTISKDYEIILIDDCSHDDSFEKMKEVKRDNPAVKLIRLERNFGQQNAILCGLRYTKGECAVTLDDDMQNPPEEIVSLLKCLEKGYDVVYGIPRAKKHSTARNLGSLLADFLFNVICGKPRRVRVSSFRAMKRDIIDKVIQERTSFVYISAITLRHTKNIGNVTVAHKQRKYGNSNYSIRKLIKLFYNIYINYSRIGRWVVKNDKPQYEIKEMYF